MYTDKLQEIVIKRRKYIKILQWFQTMNVDKERHKDFLRCMKIMRI